MAEEFFLKDLSSWSAAFFSPRAAREKWAIFRVTALFGYVGDMVEVLSSKGEITSALMLGTYAVTQNACVPMDVTTC